MITVKHNIYLKKTIDSCMHVVSYMRQTLIIAGIKYTTKENSEKLLSKLFTKKRQSS